MVKISKVNILALLNELVQLTGISQPNTSTLESDARQMGRDRAITLTKALKVHPALLLFLDFDIF